MALKLFIRSGMAVAMCLWLSSCGTPKNISYFQDLKNETVLAAASNGAITIKPEDKISIVVKSKDPQLSDLFNLPYVSRQIGMSKEQALSSNTQGISCYNVTTEGTIDFPVLGQLKVSGMTREQISTLIKERLIKENLMKDPVVTVEFANLRFSVMGEVTQPGQYGIDREKVTILDALSQAGDLTIYGRRDNVLVLRREEGKQKVYRVNLNSGDSLLTSPVYYIQQNDVVYVDPNETRQRQSTVNGNNIRSTSFWVSIASLLTSIAVLIAK